MTTIVPGRRRTAFVRHRRGPAPQPTISRPDSNRPDPGLHGTPWEKAAVNLQGIDTLVAMPQWYINLNLADLLQYGRTTGGASLRTVALRRPDDADAWLKGVVSALETAVYVPGQTTKVTFLVTFNSGTMDYFPGGQAGGAARAQCDIGGLRFGLHVDLDHARVHSTDYAELPDDVRERIHGLRPGAFTVEQLLMNLQDADCAQYDPASTRFPDAMPADAVQAFPGYLTAYLRDVADAGGQVLGYAVTVPDGNDPIATFPPTSVDLVTNQYRVDTEEDPDRRPDLDTVNYLLMTRDRPLPTPLESWWGNLVEPTDGRDDTWYGTIATAKSLFVDAFLLPRLAPAVCGYWELSDDRNNLAVNRRTANGWFQPNALGGSWSIGPRRSRSHKTNTFSNDDVDYTFSWNVSLNAVPGTNRVVINRIVDFDIAYTHWYGVEGHAVSSSFRVWYNVPLTITITVLGVMNGRLQVDVKSATRQPAPNVQYGDPYGWDITRTEGSRSIWNSVSKTLDRVIEDSVQMAMPPTLLPGIEKILTDDLNLTPFVFPGGNQLNMTDPTFGYAGDLLLGLSYKA